MPSTNPSAWVDCFNSITVKRHSVLLAATHHLADTPAHGGLARGRKNASFCLEAPLPFGLPATSGPVFC